MKGERNELSETREWSDVRSVEDARKLLKQRGICHVSYNFYSTVDRVVGMLESGYLWLTRLDSEKFDDGIEHKKYGTKNRSSRLFVKCFQFGRQESAAMWGLYCPPTYQALRVSIPATAMKELAQQACFRIRGKKVTSSRLAISAEWIQDMAYASVGQLGSDVRRANVLWHDGEYTKPIKGLTKMITGARSTGVVKDAEWKFEDEARLFVQTKKPSTSAHVAVKLPETVVESMSFVLSPWCSKPEGEFVKSRLEKVVSKFGSGHFGIHAIRDSLLRGGLRLWAERRGLD